MIYDCFIINCSNCYCDYCYQEEKYDANGNPIWHCRVCIPGTKAEFFEDSTSKKEAKKEAAFKLLQYLLDK